MRKRIFVSCISFLVAPTTSAFLPCNNRAHRVPTISPNKQKPHTAITATADRSGSDNNKKPFRRKQKRSISFDPNKLEWLRQATDRLLLVSDDERDAAETATITAPGKWHQAISLLHAWSAFVRHDGQAPVQMEALLKVLVNERYKYTTSSSLNESGNSTAVMTLSINLYNAVLNAWAVAALFRTVPDPVAAARRAREILVLLQHNYEASLLAGLPNTTSNNSSTSTSDTHHRPNAESFDVVLHVASRIEGALTARRLLAWMEHLHKTGKNADAKPSRLDYIQLLETYTRDYPSPQAGVLAEAFLRHLKRTASPDLHLPDTFCYNIAIKAWLSNSNTRQQHARGQRQGVVRPARGRFVSKIAAEHADRLLQEMKEDHNTDCQPDVITYASVISAWAASGTKAHAVSRVEALLREMEEADNGIQANTVVLNSVMSAWVKAKNPAAVERTLEILQSMELSPSPSGEQHHTKPDLMSYNTHLHALSMHAGPKRPELAQRAEDLLLRMERDHDSGKVSFGPNVFSYNLCIEAICKTQDASCVGRAARLLRKLVKRESVEPDTFSFNQVLMALAKSSTEQGSAKTAEELLRYMDESYRTGVHPLAKPNGTSFSWVIIAYSCRARSGEKSGAESAQCLLDEMKRRMQDGETHLKPTRVAYNALIDCWAKSGEGTFAARKAEAVLQDMQEMFDAGEKSVAPDLITFNGVLNAWAKSGTRCCGYQAEKYLAQMWALYNEGDTRVKPNDYSYNTVINAISKSKHESKAQKALRILRRMDKLYQAGNKEARPNEITYTAVINSCAFPSVPDSRTRRKALDTAMFTLKELQGSRYGQPNQVTYGTFIKACANLLHDDAEMRRAIIKRAFQQCCHDGQLGQMVLNYTPRDLREELLAGYTRSGARVTVRDLPAEWRCNVREKDQWRARR